MRLLTLVQLICLLYPLLWGGDLSAVTLKEQFERHSPWNLSASEDGVSIQTSTWPDSDFVAFRSEFTFKGSLDAILAVIRDVDAYFEWMPNGIRSELISKAQDSCVYYVALRAPWPLNDRDWVNQLVIERNPAQNQVIIEYMAVRGIRPELQSFVRVKRHIAVWIITPQTGNRIHSVWYGHSEPGGAIPAFLVNLMIDSMIIETTRNLQQQMLKSKYQN